MTDVRTIDTKADSTILLRPTATSSSTFGRRGFTRASKWRPPFDNLAGEQRVEGRLAFARVNLAETPDIGENYGINALTAYMVLVDGKKPAESREEFTLRRADPMALRHMASSLGEMARGEDV